jgi:hypothetical protein
MSVTSVTCRKKIRVNNLKDKDVHAAVFSNIALNISLENSEVVK